MTDKMNETLLPTDVLLRGSEFHVQKQIRFKFCSNVTASLI